MNEGKRVREIKITIKGETIDFDTAKKIAEAIASANNKKIKAFWDNTDGDHEPEFDAKFNDLNDVTEKWQKVLEELQVDTEINIDNQFSFYF